MRRPPPFTDFPRFPVTAGTILLAVGVTIAWKSGVDITPLVDTALVQRWQLWRLLTSVLPHDGPVHLLFDCYWTWAFGTRVEAAWGSLATGGVFALLALGSSAAEFAVRNGGVGLSGVGYGLFGLLWALGRRDRRFRDAVDRNTAFLFVVWFFGCILATYTGAMAVANVAHGAGLVLGLGLGVACGGARDRWRRVLAGTGVGLAVAACLAGSTVLRPYVNRSPEAAADNDEQGYLALKDRRNTAAVRWLTDAVRMGPRDAHAWYNLGVAYDRTDRRKEASAAFAEAHRLDPSDAGYRQAAADSVTDGQ